MDPGLVSAQQLREVAQAALEDFMWSFNSYHDFDSWAEAIQALEADLRETNKVLHEAGLPPVDQDVNEKVDLVVRKARSYCSPSNRQKEKASHSGLCGPMWDNQDDSDTLSEGSFETDKEPALQLLA